MNVSRSSPRRPLAVWMAGRVGLDDYGALAERLAWEVSEPDGRPPTLVLYDPEPSITIGRLGSRADVELTPDELRSRRLETRFVGRGGGAVPHGPGQVGIAMFAKLADLGFASHRAGGVVDRLEAGLESAIRDVRCGVTRDSRMHGIFGRTGLLAAIGIAIRRGVVWHGGFLNVRPEFDHVHRVRAVPYAAPNGLRVMGSIEADVQRKVRMQDARSAVVRQLGDAFGFPEIHVQAGLPVSVRGHGTGRREHFSRVG